MKKLLSTLLSVLFCAITFAQSVPQGINYQAVARDANGDVLMNQALTIQFSVISDSITGTVSWQETHPVTTNEYGLFTAIVGGGTSTSAGSSSTFDVVNWGSTSHYLNVEINYGSGYVDMGTTQFMSVPYALQAGNSVFEFNANGTGIQAPTDTASGDYSIAIGQGASASGDYSIAVGKSAGSSWPTVASGDYSTAIGLGNKALGWGSMAMGSYNESAGSKAVAIGWWNNASGDNSTAIGTNTLASGYYSTAMGYDTEASGEASTAMGYDTEASGYYSTAMGKDTEASGSWSTSMGNNTVASGYNSTSMGVATEASGYQSVAMGSYTDATGTSSTAMGYQTEARAYQLVIGNNNIASGNLTNWVSSDAAFIIGNGVNNPSNALRATKNGNLFITGTLSSASDIRLKTKITPVGNVLSALEFITPITYEFKDTQIHPEGVQIGFSAQEIQAQFPALVRENAKGDLTVAYGQMSAVLLQAIKEQQAIIESQKTEIADMRAEIAGRLKAIEETLNTTTLNK